MQNDQIHGNGSNLPAGSPAEGAIAGHRPRVRRAISVRHTLVVLFSHKTLILLVAAALIMGTVAGIYYLPAHYRSEAKLLVRLGRESVVIDPTASIGQAAVPMEGRDREINSEIELLKSRKLTEAVVAKIGANRILSRKPDAATTSADLAGAIGAVEEKMSVEAVPDSNFLLVGFDSSDPELSRDVLIQMIDSYLAERSRVYRDRGDLKFFQGQLENARRQQAAVQRKLRDLRDSTGISNPDQERTLLLARIDTLQHDIDTARADLDVVTNSIGAKNLHREREMANLAALQARVQSLEASKLKAKTSLSAIDEVESRSKALEQEQTLAAATVAKYAEAYEQARIDEQMGQQRIGNISIAQPPTLPFRAKGPSRSLLLLAGIFLAVSVGLGSAFVADALDHTVHRVEDLHTLGLTQVVSIPYVSEYSEPYFHALSPTRRAVLEQSDEPDESADELRPAAPLRALMRPAPEPAPARPPVTRTLSTADLASGETLVLTDETGAELISVRSVGNGHRPVGPLAVSPNILAAIRGVVDRLIPLNGQSTAPRVIGVVATQNDEGASTIALHLAIALAHRIDTGLDEPSSYGRVLLVDSDLESPTSSLLSGAASARGLGDWVAQRTSDLQPLMDLVMPTRQRMLDVLPAGAARERSPLSQRMTMVLRTIRQRYRHAVIDLPSVLSSDASAQMAGLCDAVVFVCQASQLRVEAAQESVRYLREAGAKINLAVLNKRRYPVPAWAYRLT